MKSYTPLGPPTTFSDFAVNSLWAPNAIAVTFGSATGTESYGQANVFFLG